jgi:membrane-associated phospholipid phosphatase
VTGLAPSRPSVAAVGIAGFLATAVLVATGALDHVDRYAVSHLMPWLDPRRSGGVSIHSLILPRLTGSTAERLAALWTYPAAVVPSLVLVAVAARLELRLRALAWPALWLAGNAVELAGKLVVERPALYDRGIHVTALDSSLPSGHTIRAFVVAGALAAARRGGRAAFAWAAGVPFALVALGDHTPTDIVAALFVVVALAGWAPSLRMR